MRKRKPCSQPALATGGARRARRTPPMPAGLRACRRFGVDQKFLLNAASQASRPVLPHRQPAGGWRCSFLLTAAGQPRIRTGFPLSARPHGRTNRHWYYSRTEGKGQTGRPRKNILSQGIAGIRQHPRRFLPRERRGAETALNSQTIPERPVPGKHAQGIR